MPFMVVGSNFTGKSGKAYTSGAAVQIDPPDVADAIRGGGSMIDAGDTNSVTATLPSGATHNYLPNGFGTATKALLVTCNSAGSTLGGLVGGDDGQQVLIANVSAGAYTLTLTHRDASSAATNQFQAAADVSITQYGAALVQYCAATGYWHVVSII